MTEYISNIRNIIQSVDEKYRNNKLASVFNDIELNLFLLEQEINEYERKKVLAINEAKQKTKSASDALNELSDDMTLRTK